MVSQLLYSTSNIIIIISSWEEMSYLSWLIILKDAILKKKKIRFKEQGWI